MIDYTILEYAEALHTLIVDIDDRSPELWIVLTSSPSPSKTIRVIVAQEARGVDVISKQLVGYGENSFVRNELLTLVVLYSEEVCRRASVNIAVGPGRVGLFSIRLSK